jgi:hypothetical protein
VHEPNLKLFTGFRSLAFIGVVFGEQYLFLASQAPNPEQVTSLKNSVTGLLLMSTLYASDVFLWLSGFLMAKKMLDKVLVIYTTSELYRRVPGSEEDLLLEVVRVAGFLQVAAGVPFLFHRSAAVHEGTSTIVTKARPAFGS